jgi:phage terminase large subunit
MSESAHPQPPEQLGIDPPRIALATVDGVPVFDWKNPDYLPVFLERERRLLAIREDVRKGGSLLADLRLYYAEHIDDWINDWCVTVDPRNAARKLPTVMPFLLWPKQRDFVKFVLEGWRMDEGGLIEKSRDQGVSWLAMGVSCGLATLMEGINIGFGSRKEELVDKSDDPKCLFYKGRAILSNLPEEFRSGWTLQKNSAHMRLSIPNTRSSITGEAGDNIGRGDRCSIYFVDEAAHLEHPKLVDASLIATTNCRIDMSSVNGTANSFAERRNNPKTRVFTMHWRTDPRRDQAWYDALVEKTDPVVIAQEYDINYSASVEGVIIPALWVQAAIGAADKLGLKVTGARMSSLDVADRGVDKNAWGYRHGPLLKHAESWSGKDSDIYATVERACLLMDMHKIDSCEYDADGLGAGVRGDARKINETRAAQRSGKLLTFNEWRGSGGVLFPEDYVLGPDGTPLDRTNEDFYQNRKAQGWWNLRFMFQQTFRAIKGMSYDPANLICIDPNIAELARLQMELSQPVYKINNAGKMIVDKLPEGALSPNLADMVMMLYAPRSLPFNISDKLLDVLGSGY